MKVGELGRTMTVTRLPTLLLYRDEIADDGYTSAFKGSYLL
jgi:hypothetical protein